MAYKDKVRVSVPLNEDVNARVEELSKKHNMSKATICAMLIESNLEMMDQVLSMLKNPVAFKSMISQSYQKIEDEMDEVEKAINLISGVKDE